MNLVSLSETSIKILQRLLNHREENPLGFRLTEILDLLPDVARGNLHRILGSLTDKAFIVRSGDGDIKYTLSGRGDALLHVLDVISEYQLEEKIPAKRDVELNYVEYWAGGTKIHTFKTETDALNHFKETKPLAYGKNVYRAYQKNGMHEDRTIGGFKSSAKFEQFLSKPK
jgi:hypothetical protein